MASILSRPIKIGRMELKNRMVMAPMGVTVGNLSPTSVAYDSQAHFPKSA